MALPDKNRALARIANVPVVNTSTGVEDGQCALFFGATTEAVAAVTTAGYFNFARERLNVNDVIIMQCVQAGTADMIIVKVTAVPAVGSNVTVSINTAASGA